MKIFVGCYLTFTMSAGVPTNPPVKPVGRKLLLATNPRLWDCMFTCYWERGGRNRACVCVCVCVCVHVCSHLRRLPAGPSGKRAWGPGLCCPSCPSLSHRWQIWWVNRTSERRGEERRGEECESGCGGGGERKGGRGGGRERGRGGRGEGRRGEERRGEESHIYFSLVRWLP